MKFGYDSDGKLVPIEQLKLAEAIADLDVKIDGLSPESRAASTDKLRVLLANSGEKLTPEDETALALYAEGVLDFRNLEDYFGVRLQRAVLHSFGGEESAA